MSYTDSNTIIVNKISKSLYDTNVSNGTITNAMINEQIWHFTDDQFVSASDISKLAGIESGAEVNIIEGIQVNSVAQTPSSKIVNIVMPTKVSDLSNDSGFITNTVSNLSNYYTKSEVTNLIGNISTLSLQVVTSLPTSNISSSTIYLTLKAVGGTSNIYNEYIYVNNGWELIGDTQVDLTGYALTTDIPVALSDLTNDLDLSAYANVIESVKVNGVALTPDANKAVDIDVPVAKTRIWN